MCPSHICTHVTQRSFVSEYVPKPNLLASVEREVINDYIWNLNHQCQSDKYSRRRRGERVENVIIKSQDISLEYYSTCVLVDFVWFF